MRNFFLSLTAFILAFTFFTLLTPKEALAGLNNPTIDSPPGISGGGTYTLSSGQTSVYVDANVGWNVGVYDARIYLNGSLCAYSGATNNGNLDCAGDRGSGNYSFDFYVGTNYWGNRTVTVNAAPAPTASISASPNPCSIPSGGANCTSNITWSTSGYSGVTVTYTQNSAAGCYTTVWQNPTGSEPAPWIDQTGYYFNLCANNNSLFLAQVFVRGNLPVSGTIFLSSPNPCTITNGTLNCGVTIAWSSSGASNPQIFAHRPNLPNSHCSGVNPWAGASGNQLAPRIDTQGYFFDLCNGTSLIAEATYLAMGASGFLTANPTSCTIPDPNSTQATIPPTSGPTDVCNTVISWATRNTDQYGIFARGALGPNVIGGNCTGYIYAATGGFQGGGGGIFAASSYNPNPASGPGFANGSGNAPWIQPDGNTLDLCRQESNGSLTLMGTVQIRTTAPSVTISANPTTIESGSGTTLTWDIGSTSSPYQPGGAWPRNDNVPNDPGSRTTVNGSSAHSNCTVSNSGSNSFSVGSWSGPLATFPIYPATTPDYNASDVTPNAYPGDHHTRSITLTNNTGVPQTQTFNIYCTNSGGSSATQFVQVIVNPIPPPPPPPSLPWIQTTGGDVHSNTGINTPGGP